MFTTFAVFHILGKWPMMMTKRSFVGWLCLALAMVFNDGGVKAAEVIPFDLVTPKMTDQPAGPGRRVRQTSPEYQGTDVHHALYLPPDWTPLGSLPVIVEYTGNQWAQCNSTGKTEDANLGYGISGGRGFIWVSMPYIDVGRKQNCSFWWGDRQATVDYCKKNVPRICEQFGGDPDNVFVCGFSRGAIATSYIGLADDEIASLWKGALTHDHFDGQKPWNYADSDRASALTRLSRLNGRPVLVCGTAASQVRDSYLNKHQNLAQFSFLQVPTSEIFDIPEGDVVHPHTDRWMHKPSVYRDQVRDWIANVCDAQATVNSTTVNSTTDFQYASWNQGPGAGADFRMLGERAPTTWSAVRNEHVRWRKSLPETGQSSVITWEDRLFFTTMAPVNSDSELGRDVIAWCCDLDTGDTVWKRRIAGTSVLQLSGCFSDSSSPPAVTDGRTVCFFNASGAITAFDLDGNLRWTRDVMPVGRSQPVLVDGTVVFIRQHYMPDDHGHFTHDHVDALRPLWTQLQAIDLKTGVDRWSSKCGVNMGSVPLLQTRLDGRQVFVVGRGGGHSPPEKPEGISMVDAHDGSTLWTLPLPEFMSTQTFPVIKDEVLVFHRDEHLWINAMTGEINRRVSILRDVQVVQHTDDRWTTGTESLDDADVQRGIIQQSNLFVGKYHYFRSYTQPWIGRVDCEDGSVEYLQLPVQMLPGDRRTNDRLLWSDQDMDPALVKQLLDANRKKPKRLPITQWAFAPNNMLNSRGHRVMGDARSQGNGWGHHASQIPTVIGKSLYVPTMAGTVYVIDWNADQFDEKAITAINDLGPPGKAWNRASLTSAGGRLFAHTISELLCLEASETEPTSNSAD
ncbi:outer membrane protein assembly factor BamB family protein [Rubripirellula reticaptiva]|uniref:Outer membrane protein assembly factor BamB n=1 Tax=Rubripirellula reticaptiva TaxID=2528013 RepID=A0A5C6F698_9BACT|nr:PQQ-binding-like beta-propeller repeat protein [Rubripirellula reticaptiva]TWU56090.1 Outer membrane protein assembly factor BamB [Rubripirellula reticaptiva]